MMVVALCLTVTARAQQLIIPLSETEKDNFTLAIDSLQLGAHLDQTMSLTLQYCLTGKKLPRGQRVIIEPVLKDSTHAVSFKPIEIYGTYAYYDFVRYTKPLAPDTTPLQLRHLEVRNYQPYHHSLTSEPWMSRAELILHVTRTDGCGNELSCQTQSVVAPTPTYRYKQDGAVREVQLEQFHGTAYVAFPVNRTELLIDFRDNRRELSQLKHTIDSVINSPNIEIHSITIKGFASPEGSYASNEQLARGRTNSLSHFIASQSNIAPELIHTDYEPEDWQGLRRHVAYMQLPDREELLKLIDADMDPDEKLYKIATTHTPSFRILLEQVFPLLRHTDYQISYTRKNVTEHQGSFSVDTLYSLPLDTLPVTPDTGNRRFKPYRPLLALKTNMLLDLALAPNIEIEVPFGSRRQFSIMAETWFPWYRLGHNEDGDKNRYHRSDQLPTRYSYELQNVGLELRYWFGSRCASRPVLTGTFVGIYGAGGKYDLEWKSVGNQGEYTSFGISAGHSWLLGRHWNLELSGSVGYVGGPMRHYEAEFDDARLIFRNYDKLRYIGPTKLKLSLVYVLGTKLRQR